jgi:hypothetical protein
LKAKPEYAYLRLKRSDETFYPYVSPDGEKWTLLTGGAGFRHLPAMLKVGLAAYSTSSERSKVRFDQFKLIQDRKK